VSKEIHLTLFYFILFYLFIIDRNRNKEGTKNALHTVGGEGMQRVSEIDLENKGVEGNKDQEREIRIYSWLGEIE
jgi:hypothetical protein